MKVWKDANEVIKMVHELPSNKLRKTEREMIAIPKFDKNIDKKKKENLELSRIIYLKERCINHGINKKRKANFIQPV